jgi:hypothetical protein
MSTWKKYQDTIRGCESWDELHPDYLRIAERFASISENDKPSAELTWQILESISRGHALIRSARNWTNPAIGNRKGSEVSKCRGEQWRFLQVFAGFEVMTKAVFGYEKKGLITWGDELKNRIAASGIFDDDTVTSPMDKKPMPPALKRWKDEPEL